MVTGADRRTGRVVDFDTERGVGTVGSAEDGTTLFFHCTAIADGSRQIDPGSEVTYLVRPGHLGRWEAADLRPA